MSPIVRAAASYPRKHSDCPCSRVISRWLWWRRYWWRCWISLVSFQTTRTHVISENVQCHNKVQNSPTLSTTTTTGPSNYLQSDPMVNSSPRRKEGHPNRGLRPPVAPPTTFSDFNSQEATVVWAKPIFNCVPSIAQVLPRIAQVFPRVPQNQVQSSPDEPLRSGSNPFHSNSSKICFCYEAICGQAKKSQVALFSFSSCSPYFQWREYIVAYQPAPSSFGKTRNQMENGSHLFQNFSVSEKGRIFALIQ